MLAITGAQMRKIDKYTIEEIGIPSIVLMENAKNALMKHISLKNYENYIIIAGIGNNGGDGIAVCRDLILKGKNVSLFVMGNMEKASKDFLINYNIIKNLNGEIFHINKDISIEDFSKKLNNKTFLIDALFGTGLSRDIQGDYKVLIDSINRSKAYKFSVDIPSGMNSETGEDYGIMVDSDYIVTLAVMKKGLLKTDKKVIVEDIGIPKTVVKKIINS